MCQRRMRQKKPKTENFPWFFVRIFLLLLSIGGFLRWLIRKLLACITLSWNHQYLRTLTTHYVYVHMHKWMRKDSDARRNRVNKIFFLFHFISFYYSLIHSLSAGEWNFFVLRTLQLFIKWGKFSRFVVEICIKWTEMRDEL